MIKFFLIKYVYNLDLCFEVFKNKSKVVIYFLLMFMKIVKI